MSTRAVFCVPWVLCCVACSSAPPLRTYLLTPPLTSEAHAPPLAPMGAIGVRRLFIPDYLDTTDILVRSGNHEVKASATGRWGERLSHGLTRALAADLGSRLPSARVSIGTPSSTQRQVLVSVNALDLWPDGRCALSVTWTLVDHGAPRIDAGGAGTFDSAPAESIISGDERLIDALSRTVGKLADAITSSIMQLPEWSAPRAE